MKLYVTALIIFLQCSLTSYAIILYGLENTKNISDPGTGFNFDAIARVSADGGSSPAGSAIYLGNKFMLTANHVTVNNETYVSFDNSTYIARDTSFAPVQVATDVDMKVFKLMSNPTGVTNVTFSKTAEGRIGSTVYQVGFGVGRGSTSTGSDVVVWGGR